MSGELVEDSVTEKELGNCRENLGSSTGNAFTKITTRWVKLSL